MAQDPLESKQVHKLLQLVSQKNKELVEKFSMRTPGVINMTESEEGTSALHLVAMSHDMDMARFLLSLNAHPDIQDKMGRTPMMLAAELGDVHMVELLANNRANMTLVDKEGKGLLVCFFFLIYFTVCVRVICVTTGWIVTEQLKIVH